MENELRICVNKLRICVFVLAFWAVAPNTGKGKFLAHLWGAYVILSAVRRQACAVCIHHNYQK